MNETITLNITGDFVIKDSYRDYELLDQSIIEHFKHSHYNVVNLECPVTSLNTKNQITKTGPHLRTSPQSITRALNSLNINLVTLANNHIMDYDEQGLLDTLHFCRNHSLSTVGAGIRLREAQKFHIANISNRRIAFVNFAENEWASATQYSAGANPMNLVNNIRQIHDAKSTADIVIVIVHGGHEYYNLPSPRMVNQYRFYAEQGADLVVGHHPHCYSGVEQHEGVPILYSLGNFLFTSTKTYDCWYTGLVAQVTITDNNKLSCQLVPIRQDRSDFKLYTLSGEERDFVLTDIQKLNLIIADESLLQQHWEKYLAERTQYYLANISALTWFKNPYIKAIFRKLIKDDIILPPHSIKRILNLVRCEAHREILISALNHKLNSKR